MHRFTHPVTPNPPPSLISKLLAEWAFPSAWRAGLAMIPFLMLLLLQRTWDVSAFSHHIHTLLHAAVSQHQMLAALGVSVSSIVNPCSSTGYKSSSEEHQLETCPVNLGGWAAQAASPQAGPAQGSHSSWFPSPFPLRLKHEMARWNWEPGLFV